MYEKSALMFLYCVSPLHMGAGTAIGAIDNPIQRERHTTHPMIVGSGIKGALRHACSLRLANLPEDHRALETGRLTLVFGPDTKDSNDHAGSLSITDAQIVLFPVRSLRHTFVYATCPTALARLQRLITVALGESAPQFATSAVPEVDETHAIVLDPQLLGSDEGLVLEAFRFDWSATGTAELQEFAKWLAGEALPSTPPYFRNKVEKHLVLLHDNWFAHFARQATVVEPHVRINDESGTADDGGLFYTENLPPESLLVSLVMATRSRRAASGGATAPDRMNADQVLAYVRDRTHDHLLQLGGDATTGRGHVMVRGVGPLCGALREFCSRNSERRIAV